ncbi:hypothetical protein [Archangium violaceum]|uniref:hypothetical protein n=1 Tax=Archangium violaceum TaxID=83451 RepID=UPI0036DB3938
MQASSCAGVPSLGAPGGRQDLTGERARSTEEQAELVRKLVLSTTQSAPGVEAEGPHSEREGGESVE